MLVALVVQCNTFKRSQTVTGYSSSLQSLSDAKIFGCRGSRLCAPRKGVEHVPVLVHRLHRQASVGDADPEVMKEHVPFRIEPGRRIEAAKGTAAPAGRDVCRAPRIVPDAVGRGG